MNTQTQEALKMAIEAMEYSYAYTNKKEVMEKALKACKEALATEQVREASRVRQNDVQPAQDPVAWLNPSNGAVICKQKKKQIGLDGKVNSYLNFSVPLYTHPTLAIEPLSNDERQALLERIYEADGEHTSNVSYIFL